uniref:Uncharacterized protein n=1 Tax=Euplotes crassus TaxID=5936 RepID=A0A7S3KR91_EUPCR|mmetsp:Transcript_38583/g.38102  ORF Transcript_38583/g.38102 Transcript_38583/m.38102 type:complete len:229 (+) Transcript_38583:527-1213(+)
MTFYKRPEHTQASIEISGNADAGNIKGSFVADSSGYEGIAHVSSAPMNPSKHTYKYKLPYKFVGELSLDSKVLLSCNTSTPCLGIHDNARGFFPYASRWIWGSSMFNTGEHEVALNFGFSHDNPHGSFDALIVDGKLYKLDPLLLTEVDDDHWEWTRGSTTKHKNTINLKFKRAHNHSIGTNFLVYNIDLSSNFGYFSGEIQIQNGKETKTIKFNDVFGFIEDFHARW